jgi:hypothetical protein
MNKSQAYCLYWFPKIDEIAIGEEDVDCSPEDVIKWFGLNDNDHAYFCYDITLLQVPILQKYVKHIINLEQYDYSLDCYDPSYATLNNVQCAIGTQFSS